MMRASATLTPAVVPAGPVPPTAAGSTNTPSAWAGSPLDWLPAIGDWIDTIPDRAGRALHLAAALWWPWAPLAVLVLLLGILAGRMAHRALWRRVVAGGYWLALTPPRTIDAARWTVVWRRLLPLAKRARRGRWHLIRPPLAFEIHSDGGRLRAGLWLPGWVPPAEAAAEVARAWPGTTVEQLDPPTVHAAGGAVAGYRLAADSLHPEYGWLVDDIRPRTRGRGVGADPDLGGVFAALAASGGPVLLQVLARPATNRRLARLASAGHKPVKAPRPGGLWMLDAVAWLLGGIGRALGAVVDFATPGNTANSSRSTRAEPPDAVQREAMADARAKLADRPLMLATVRVVASGNRRDDAREAAQSAVYGFAEASRWLNPARLRRPAAAADRWAGRGDWLLLTASEVGVLAHLPPDPALYGFDTAALHRGFPGGTPRAEPERPGPTRPGWTRHGWTTAPGAVDDDGTDDNEDDYWPPEAA